MKKKKRTGYLEHLFKLPGSEQNGGKCCRVKGGEEGCEAWPLLRQPRGKLATGGGTVTSSEGAAPAHVWLLRACHVAGVRRALGVKHPDCEDLVQTEEQEIF